MAVERIIFKSIEPVPKPDGAIPHSPPAILSCHLLLTARAQASMSQKLTSQPEPQSLTAVRSQALRCPCIEELSRDQQESPSICREKPVLGALGAGPGDSCQGSLS